MRLLQRWTETLLVFGISIFICVTAEYLFGRTGSAILFLGFVMGAVVFWSIRQDSHANPAVVAEPNDQARRSSDHEDASDSSSDSIPPLLAGLRPDEHPLEPVEEQVQLGRIA
jgi:hypothetical protein